MFDLRNKQNGLIFRYMLRTNLAEHRNGVMVEILKNLRLEAELFKAVFLVT